MLDPDIGKLLDAMYESVDVLTMEDGDLYISVHTIDMMSAIIQNSVRAALMDGTDIPDECLMGVAWVASLYQMLHDTVELKGNNPVPDTPAGLD